ncbi:MAG: GAF domain-containing protein [Cytophagales bacterium]|nr:GAF domain-containing protein [Cytophagales bacterium]
MKSLYNRLNVLLTIFFVLGILLTAYNLFNLPDSLEKISGRIDLSVVRELSPVLNQTYFIVGLTLLLGLGSIIFSLYLLNYSKAAEKIVYVDKAPDKKEDEKDKNDEHARIQNLSARVHEIKSGLEAIKDIKEKYRKVLSNLCMKMEASQGIIYRVIKERNKRYIELFTSFAYSLPESETLKFEFGEGLAGQVAKERRKLNIKDVPEGYVTIISGLGASSPNHLAILPIEEEGEVSFVIEIASFNEITESDEELVIESLKMEDKISAKKPKVKKAESKDNSK